MRKHFATMCFRENIEVTYTVKDGDIIVIYEKAVRNGLHRAHIKLDGSIILQEGFTSSDMEYLIKFTFRNVLILESLVRGKV